MPELCNKGFWSQQSVSQPYFECFAYHRPVLVAMAVAWFTALQLLLLWFDWPFTWLWLEPSGELHDLHVRTREQICHSRSMLQHSLVSSHDAATGWSDPIFPLDESCNTLSLRNAKLQEPATRKQICHSRSMLQHSLVRGVMQATGWSDPIFPLDESCNTLSLRNAELQEPATRKGCFEPL